MALTHSVRRGLAASIHTHWRCDAGAAGEEGEGAASRVQIAMRARREAALAKKRDAQNKAVGAARAVVKEVRVIEARAQAAYDAGAGGVCSRVSSV